MSEGFEAEARIDRLAVALRGLAEGQRPFLEEYWPYTLLHRRLASVEPRAYRTRDEVREGRDRAAFRPAGLCTALNVEAHGARLLDVHERRGPSVILRAPPSPFLQYTKLR